MRQTSNKQFEYNGHNFNIQVELNMEVERRPNGTRLHLVTINCIDDENYNITVKVDDMFLVTRIQELTWGAKRYVDEKLNPTSSLDPRLAKLGFQ